MMPLKLVRGRMLTLRVDIWFHRYEKQKKGQLKHINGGCESGRAPLYESIVEADALKLTTTLGSSLSRDSNLPRALTKTQSWPKVRISQTMRAIWSQLTLLLVQATKNTPQIARTW